MDTSVLIVDDSMFARGIIKRSLEICGLDDAEFYEAGNGLEALDILGSRKIDLVFTDLNMPDMNGEELLDQINHNFAFLDIPVVVITSLNNIAKEQNLLKKTT